MTSRNDSRFNSQTRLSSFIKTVSGANDTKAMPWGRPVSKGKCSKKRPRRLTSSELCLLRQMSKRVWHSLYDEICSYGLPGAATMPAMRPQSSVALAMLLATHRLFPIKTGGMFCEYTLTAAHDSALCNLKYVGFSTRTIRGVSGTPASLG